MAKKTQDTQEEQDGRLVATTGINVGGTDYQKGEFVDTSGLPEAELAYYVEAGIFWTETQWIGKYKEDPVEHEDKEVFPRPQGTMTTAQGASAIQTADPALRREGDPRVESTTSGQTPPERAAATGTEPGGSQSPAQDARTTTSTAKK
jgi:hypothetical protein